MKINTILSDYIDLDNLENDKTWNNVIDDDFKSKYINLMENKKNMFPEEIRLIDNQLIAEFKENYIEHEIPEEEQEVVFAQLNSAQKIEKENKRLKEENERIRAEKERLASEKERLASEKEQKDKEKEKLKKEEAEKLAAEEKLKKEEEAEKLIVEKQKAAEIKKLLSGKTVRKSLLAEYGVEISGKNPVIEIDGISYNLLKKIGYKDIYIIK